MIILSFGKIKHCDNNLLLGVISDYPSQLHSRERMTNVPILLASLKLISFSLLRVVQYVAVKITVLNRDLCSFEYWYFGAYRRRRNFQSFGFEAVETHRKFGEILEPP